MIDRKYKVEREKPEATTTLYIVGGIPELSEDAPYWLYNDLRDLLHVANKCENDADVGILLDKIEARGYTLTSTRLTKGAICAVARFGEAQNQPPIVGERYLATKEPIKEGIIETTTIARR